MIGESGEQLGVMPLLDARQMARERDVDLVEVAPTAQPPVCRLMDFGKFKYEQAKKERQAHKSQKSTGLREVRMRPKIGQHDIDFKIRLVKKLLEEGNKVKILVIFRGREIVYPHLGKALMEEVIESLGEAAKVERAISMEGRRMIVILSPGKPGKGGKNAETKNP
ncbi:MAG: Translation initiation factor IF-3 [Dehalococcoidia bacterium]|nr:Translation initiation factor IF-3 [Chloroflexota bacterium]